MSATSISKVAVSTIQWPAPSDKQGGTMRGSTDRFIGYTSIPDGVVNADGVLRRLAQDGYTGYVTLEPHVNARRRSTTTGSMCPTSRSECGRCSRSELRSVAPPAAHETAGGIPNRRGVLARG